MKCLFCDIINNEVPVFNVWEDDDFLAFLDINPINSGHTLLIPKVHIEDVFNMSDNYFRKLFLTAKKIAPILQKATRAKRVGMAVEGFGVPHAHLHLVPVNNGNELNPEKAKTATEAELNNIQKLILKIKKLSDFK